MNRVNISEIETLDDVKKYPDDTMFIMDKSEKEVKIPDCLRNKDKNTTVQQ